jgi:hypothetical protein
MSGMGGRRAHPSIASAARNHVTQFASRTPLKALLFPPVRSSGDSNMPVWSKLEDEVRAASKTIWSADFHSEVLHGRQIDAYAQIDQFHAVAVEVTTEKRIDKIQDDLNKLIHVRQVNFSTNALMTECYCVTSYIPTPAMQTVCRSANIVIYSIAEFRARFLPFDNYSRTRSSQPFGSAVDPATGKKDERQYIFVHFSSYSGTEYGNIERIRDEVLSKEKLILIGEYGTGKSKSFEKLFELLSSDAWARYIFPVAIDLRKCWGLKDKFEIIRRHFDDLGLSDSANAFLKAYSEGYLLLLIDGFDEMNTQAWSEDPQILRNIRADALTGVRDLVASQKGGMIVCGRDHYFDGQDELIAVLGLANKKPVCIRTNDEFTYDEIAAFLENAEIDVDIPEWLPRKPLTCEFYIKLVREQPGLREIETLDPIQFWDLYLNAVCQRESQLNISFDEATIKNILVSVSAITRLKPDGVGPITLAEIQSAFEQVVGFSSNKRKHSASRRARSNGGG